MASSNSQLQVTDHRITFVYQNKSESPVTVQMDLSGSSGILHSRESQVFSLTVPKKSSAIAAHVVPGSEGTEWVVKSSARIVRR